MVKKPKVNLHRGEVLNAVVKRSNYTISQVVKKTGYSRASFYNHIQNKDLPFEILERYGNAVGYDFSEEFPEMVRYVAFKEPDAEYDTIDLLKKDRDRWRYKYYDLLERYNIFIEEKLEKAEKEKEKS
jgi:predicted DNA-binding transcriptional regulator AlpA